MKIVNKENEQRIEIQSLLSKKINPSFKFYIINNLQLLQTLINDNLKKEEINELFNSKEIYIPFWVFLIRNMSSINCIKYDLESNPFSKDISVEIRQKIEEIIKKDNKLDDGWLNLIQKEIPNEILITNIHLFYTFYNNLFDKCIFVGNCKKEIQKLFKKYLINSL